MTGVHEIDVLTAIQAQVVALAKKLESSNVSTVTTQACNNYGGGHMNGVCQSLIAYR